MFDKIRSDFRTVFEMDPAATSKLEVLFTYAGFHAIVMHRFAHWIYRLGMPFFARIISQLARFLTGIEIHPAAKIGGHFFIDHGMGVVIGETTEIGEHVTLFQGVTLGGTGKERGKRHPTLGNHVVIGTGAKVLGGITVGDHVKVGANSVVLKSVPPHSTVVGVPGRVVRMHGEKTVEMAMLDHTHMPDPLGETLLRMQKQISRLEQKLFEEKPAPQASQAGPVKKARTRGMSRAAKFTAPGGVKVEELPAETVQERQARMARMEKDERMKALALKRLREVPAQPGQPGQAEQQPPAGEGAPPAKKRPRRRRRVKKPGQGEASGQAGPAGDASSGEGSGSVGAAESMPPAQSASESGGYPEAGGE
jgi:serine O-acetyltransferase